MIDHIFATTDNSRVTNHRLAISRLDSIRFLIEFLGDLTPRPISEIPWIHIPNGEPFLRLPDLIKVVEEITAGSIAHDHILYLCRQHFFQLIHQSPMSQKLAKPRKQKSTAKVLPARKQDYNEV